MVLPLGKAAAAALLSEICAPPGAVNTMAYADAFGVCIRVLVDPLYWLSVRDVPTTFEGFAWWSSIASCPPHFTSSYRQVRLRLARAWPEQVNGPETARDGAMWCQLVARVAGELCSLRVGAFSALVG
jgi:hypothetical protein